MNEDWDTLILLDACRYDDFARQNSLGGDLQSRLSGAADSREFVDRNFVGRELHDTVYVTANPHCHLVDDHTFHAVVDEPISAWDPSLQCVPPGRVTDAARNAHERYTNKRIIVHYMQPHDPPLGETAEQIRDEIRIGGPINDETEDDGPRIMEAVAAGDIPTDVARTAYRETLDIVLEEVEDLLEDIDGRVVVSADHGEMFGEQPYPIVGRLYEHYRHPHTTELCRVPWFVVEERERREIWADSPPHTSDMATDDVSEQLEALGYR
jgi:hypothetical protein